MTLHEGEQSRETDGVAPRPTVITGASAGCARTILPSPVEDPPAAVSMKTPLEAAAQAKHSDKILAVAWDLALVQALSPMVKDDHGFNNADFPLAFKLVATQDVQSLAKLLLLYPDQAQAKGLDREVLRTFADLTPGGAGGVGGDGSRYGERSELQGQLREVREKTRGELGWRDVPDEKLVLTGGLTLQWETRSIVRDGAIPGGPAGVYRIPYDNLKRTVVRLEQAGAKVENFDGLKALAESLPPPALAAQMDELHAALDPSMVLLSATKNPKGGFSVGYINPFTTEGTRLKDMVKKLGGTFDGPTKTWSMGTVQAQALAVLMEDDPAFGFNSFREAVGEPSSKALELAENLDQVQLKVLYDNIDGATIQIPKLLTQAEGRADRIGQTGTVTIHYPIANDTFDGHLLSVLQGKNVMIDAWEGSASNPDIEKKAGLSVMAELLKEMRRAEKAEAKASEKASTPKKSRKTAGAETASVA